MCREVLALLAEHELTAVPSTTISVVTRIENRPIRIYSVTLPAAEIVDVGSGKRPVQEVAANEFSMLDNVIKLIS